MSSSDNVPEEKKMDMNWALKIYEGIIKDIKFSKNQQWKTTYYTLLIYSAIVFLSKKSINENKLFCITTVLIMSFAIIIIWKIHLDLWKNRQYIIKIREKYPIIRELLGINQQDELDEGAKKYQLTYPLTFSSVVIGGAIIICKIIGISNEYMLVILGISVLLICLIYWEIMKSFR